MADGKAAVAYVRQHAKEYNLNPNRIGIIGFSAGGTVTASVAFNYTPESRPDFAAPIYLQYEWTLKPNGVPSDAPPVFILATSDDQLGLAPHSVALYKDWTAAKKPPSCICMPKAATASACANRTSRPTTGSNVSPIGSMLRLPEKMTRCSQST
jgi:acetyl esterase/lipase